MKISIKMLAVLLLIPSYGRAQDSMSTMHRQAVHNNGQFKPTKSKFMMRGYFETYFDYQKVEQSERNNMAIGSISPIMMYRESNKLFFEAEFNAFFEDDEVKAEIEYADMSYVLNRYMTLRAGYFLLPFGTFNEKLHPPWINRSFSKPLGFSQTSLIPSNDVGFELRGAFLLSGFKLNYQAYVVNGPHLVAEDGEHKFAGMLDFGYHTDNNWNKSIGGRLGFFPFSNSMLEIGLSGFQGTVGTDHTEYENVAVDMAALDVSFVRKLDFIHGIIDIKAQLNSVKVDRADYIVDDSTGTTYTFDNNSTAHYAQISYRPVISSKHIRRIEAVYRYSVLNTPVGASWEQNASEISAGLNYWIDWRTVIKCNYRTQNGLLGSENHVMAQSHHFVVQWAMGF